MVSPSRAVAFVPTTNASSAREFFEGKLGLEFLLSVSSS